MMSPLSVLVFLLGLTLVSCLLNFTTVYEWQELDYTWRTEEERNKAILFGAFVPKNIEPVSMAVYKESRIFLSLTSSKDDDGVPMTLVSLPTSSPNSPPPKLAPFPNWKLNEKAIGCKTIRAASGMKLDSEGRLWVLEHGKGINCTAKLWIFNLEDNDKVEIVHHFHESHVTTDWSEDFVIINMLDIVLDKTPEDWLAYITDGVSKHITAFSLNRNMSWTLNFGKKKFEYLALSPRNEEGNLLYLKEHYYKKLYAAPVSELRSYTRKDNIAMGQVGTCNPRGMLIDDDNVWYSVPYDNTNWIISTWNTSEPFESREERILYQAKKSCSDCSLAVTVDANAILWIMNFAQHGTVLSKAAVSSWSNTTSVTTASPSSTYANDVKQSEKFDVQNRELEGQGLESNLSSKLTYLNAAKVACCVVAILWAVWKAKQLRNLAKLTVKENEDALQEVPVDHKLDDQQRPPQREEVGPQIEEVGPQLEEATPQLEEVKPAKSARNKPIALLA